MILRFIFHSELLATYGVTVYAYYLQSEVEKKRISSLLVAVHDIRTSAELAPPPLSLCLSYTRGSVNKRDTADTDVWFYVKGMFSER